MFFHNWIHMLVGIPALLIAIAFHEYAHGKTAALLGDPTPESQGRLSLNPLKHLDPLGALMLVVVGFGWAKPVQVNPFHFRGDKRRGMLYVALAGPVMNFILAYFSALLLKIAAIPNNYWLLFLQYLLWYNAMLAVFNLIPLPPLDGSKILAGLLPRSQGAIIYQLEAYGPFILLILLATGMLGSVLRPMVNALLYVIQAAAGWGIY